MKLIKTDIPGAAMIGLSCFDLFEFLNAIA